MILEDKSTRTKTVLRLTHTTISFWFSDFRERERWKGSTLPVSLNRSTLTVETLDYEAKGKTLLGTRTRTPTRPDTIGENC